MFNQRQLLLLKDSLLTRMYLIESDVDNTVNLDLKSIKKEQLTRLISLYTTVDNQLNSSAKEIEVGEVKRGRLSHVVLVEFIDMLRADKVVKTQFIHLDQIHKALGYYGSFNIQHFRSNPELVELRWSANYNIKGSK